MLYVALIYNTCTPTGKNNKALTTTVATSCMANHFRRHLAAICSGPFHLMAAKLIIHSSGPSLVTHRSLIFQVPPIKLPPLSFTEDEINLKVVRLKQETSNL